jgi:adenylylsulfate kinase
MSEAVVFWFTGLSGSGKSTVALGTRTRLEALRYRVNILDGDEVRDKYNIHLGFTKDDITTNNMFIADLCMQRQREFDAIFVPAISPFEEVRNRIKEQFAGNYYEVFFSATLSCVMKRDVKGLYKKAVAGKIDNVIGYSAPYEPPKNPDFVIDSATETVAESIDRFSSFVATVLERQNGRSTR